MELSTSTTQMPIQDNNKMVMDDHDQPKVKLITKDQKEIMISKKIILKFQLIKDILEDGDDQSDEITTIPIPNVDYNTMMEIIEYLKYVEHNEPLEIPKPIPKSHKIKDFVNDFECEFIEKYSATNMEGLVNLCLSSNYLDIKSLLDLCCAKIAVMIKGKSPEEIRDLFGLENDFTPEEEQKIRDENKVFEEI